MGKFKSWYGVLIAVLVLTLGLGLGISKYALAWSSQVNPSLQTAPPAGDSALRVGNNVEGLAGANTAVSGGTTTSAINNPNGAPGSGSQPIPTFAGLNVKGAIVNSAGPVSIFDDAILHGLTDVKNGLTNSGGAVTIYDDLTVGSGHRSLFSGDVSIDGQLQAESGGYAVDLEVYNNLTVGSNPVNGVGRFAINGNSTLNGTLSVGGFISNPNAGAAPWGNDGPVIVQDGFYVSGKTILNGQLTVDDSLVLTGTISDSDGPVNISDSLNITSGAAVGQNLTVTGASTLTGNVDVRGNLFNNNDFKVAVNDGLQVAGKVVARDGFGTYEQDMSNIIQIPASSSATASVACGATYRLISCSAVSVTSSDYNSPSSDAVYLTSIKPSGNTCLVQGKNVSATAKYIYASALCLDPNRF